MDFCAGIGAGRLGLEMAGAKSLGYSEILSSSVKTYNLIHNTENEKNWGDLTTIDTSKLPSFDVMVAGFPCQSFSIVGQRRGLNDERGQIIYHLIRILKDKNVPYFILENVKGLVNHDKGNTLRVILDELDKVGYYVEYRVLNSIDFGVPQMRERIYFIGIRKDLKKDLDFDWVNTVKIPSLEKYLCDPNSTILNKDDSTLQRYLNNKYNSGKFDIEKLLKEEYLVLDTRQSDLRLYRGRVPTLRTGRHGILYVRDGELHRISGFESLLLQGFNEKQARAATGVVPEQQLLSQAGNAMTANVMGQLAKSLLKFTLVYIVGVTTKLLSCVV